MKKYLFMALAAIAVISFSSCEPQGEQQNPEKIVISFNKKNVEMGIGDSERATVSITGTDAIIQLSYTSSNTNVVTVSAAGLLTAVGEGKAQVVVSAEGAVGDTCYVTVSDNAMYTNFKLLDYGLFGEWTDIPGTDTIIELRKGFANVQLSTINLLAWDGDLLYSTGWSGDGLLMESEVAVFRIIAGDSTTANGYEKSVGYWVGAGGFDIVDLASEGYQYYPYCAQSGKIDVENYGKFMNSYITAKSENDIDLDASDAMIKGAYLYEWDVNNDAAYWYYPYAVVNRLAIVENDDESIDMGYDLTWSNLHSEDRYFGLKVTLNEEGKISGIVTPYDYSTVGPLHYGTLSFEKQETAKKYYIGDMKKVHKELPAFVNHKLPTDKFYKK